MLLNGDPVHMGKLCHELPMCKTTYECRMTDVYYNNLVIVTIMMTQCWYSTYPIMLHGDFDRGHLAQLLIYYLKITQ